MKESYLWSGGGLSDEPGLAGFVTEIDWAGGSLQGLLIGGADFYGSDRALGKFGPDRIFDGFKRQVRQCSIRRQVPGFGDLHQHFDITGRRALEQNPRIDDPMFDLSGGGFSGRDESRGVAGGDGEWGIADGTGDVRPGVLGGALEALGTMGAKEMEIGHIFHPVQRGITGLVFIGVPG
jgi:hypothetical protein